MQPHPHLHLQKSFFNPSQQHLVGITQFITSGQQIPAITKYMLSDFIVNEIDIKGNVVVVENRPLSIKSDDMKKKQVNYQMTKQLYSQIVDNLSQQAAKAVQTLYQRLQSGQKLNDWQFIIQNITKDKSQRLKIHTFVRQHLQNIQSNTLDNNRIRLKFNKKLKKMSPQSRKKYIYFKLFKSNIDTMSAMFKLSKITGISHKIFSSAGLKDKRGITTQMISVFNTDINRLKNFYYQADRNKEIWIDGFQEMKNQPVSVGGLIGNQFGLVLRLVNQNDDEEVKRRVQIIKQKGIINYFGMQRFGSCSTRTHLIGVKIIKKQWKQLVQQLILQKTNIPQINQLKQQLFTNKQYHKANHLLPNKYKIQKFLFQGLARYGQNYLNVFENLPRSIKTLYCHALQSYIWNKVTSRRMKQYGVKLVVGDLVGVVVEGKGTIDKEENNFVNKQEQPINNNNNNKQQQQIQPIDFQPIQQQQLDIQDESIQTILITQQNIHLYTFTDLIAPLYGISSNLPQQSLMFKYINDQLNELGLVKQDFHSKSKTLCFKGAYRKCIIKPPFIECEIVTHKGKKDQLMSPFYMKGDILKYEEGKYKAAKVILQLPKSSYATIAIREILHIPSSFKVQQQLNSMYDKL